MYANLQDGKVNQLKDWLLHMLPIMRDLEADVGPGYRTYQLTLKDGQWYRLARELFPYGVHVCSGKTVPWCALLCSTCEGRGEDLLPKPEFADDGKALDSRAQ